MGTLLTLLSRFATRVIVTLGVAILILLAANWLQSEWRNWDTETDQLKAFVEARQNIPKEMATVSKELLAQIPDGNTPLNIVAARKEFFAREVRSLDDQISTIESHRKIADYAPGSKVSIELIGAKARRALFQQAMEYTDKLQELLLSTQSCQQQIRESTKRINETRARIDGKLKEREDLLRAGGYRLHVPLSDERRRLKTLVAELESLTIEQTTASAKFDAIRTQCAAAKPADRFAITWASVTRELEPLQAEILRLEEKAEASRFRKFVQPISKVLPTAIWIVVGILAAPIAVKAIAYYLIAPWVGRCRPVRLLPGTSGVVETRGAEEGVRKVGSVSVVSLPIQLQPEEELLFHAEYLQSSALAARKDTHWLFDWSMPLTSLAAGLYGLMRIAGNSPEPIVLSSSTDPLKELAALVLPSGSAIVLQPRCLVALVRRGGQRLRITRHWRLGHLSSWLTLQLRYIVFHGPVTLVVRGCRGVRVEPVSEGRMIKQAATLGFSANVAYSNGRCETFGSYLMGQQELFNDRFSGGQGVYIYEETPQGDAKGGTAGRGIEGVLDSLLKIVGI
jgi:hypothetical protein